MKIAIVAEPYVPIPPTTYGGIEQIVYHLIRGLKEEGHTPILLAPKNSDVDCELIPIVDEPLYFPQSKKDLRAHTARVKKVNQKVDKVLHKLLPDIDLIHSHGYDLRKFRHFPNLTTLHNPITFAQIPYYNKRKDLFYATISKNFQESFPSLRYAGVVYNGEDPNDFPLVTQPDDYVCFLGRFDRDKSPHLAIQLALSHGIKIKLAGKIDHKSEHYFEDEIAQYLNHPLVDYLGELNFEEKVELLSRAQANLHPTGFREPFGLTVIEAAYCGTPTIAIARGSMPELIEQGRTGLLVEDFIEGYHHLDECFAMDREYIASRARRLFNYQTMTRQYIDAYKYVSGELPKPDFSPNVIKRLINTLQKR